MLYRHTCRQPCLTAVQAPRPNSQILGFQDQKSKLSADQCLTLMHNICFVSALVLHWVGTKLYMAVDSLYFFFFLQITDPHMCSDPGCSCLVLYGLITKNGIAPYICTASDYHSHSIFYELFPGWISALAHPGPLSSSA